MNHRLSLQDTHWPDGICFGCGPRNEKGLQIKSFVEGDEVVAIWEPASHHQAWPGIVNGGIIGTLLDCHSNMAAWLALTDGGAAPGTTVTADFAVKLSRPTPLGPPLKLVAQALEVAGRRAKVRSHIEVEGVVTATCEGTFVKLKPEG